MEFVQVEERREDPGHRDQHKHEGEDGSLGQTPAHDLDIALEEIGGKGSFDLHYQFAIIAITTPKIPQKVIMPTTIRPLMPKSATMSTTAASHMSAAMRAHGFIR